MTSVVRHTSTASGAQANTCQYQSNDAPAAQLRALLRHAQRWAAIALSFVAEDEMVGMLADASGGAGAGLLPRNLSEWGPQPAATDDARAAR